MSDCYLRVKRRYALTMRDMARVSSFVRFGIAATVLVANFACGSKPFVGHWDGALKLDKGKSIPMNKNSETKASLKSSLDINGDGTYTAKFQDVDYEGTWETKGTTLTLTPTKYMGLEKGQLPKTKSGDASAIGGVFKPYVGEFSADGKTLTHNEELGTVTFTKRG